VAWLKLDVTMGEHFSKVCARFNNRLSLFLENNTFLRLGQEFEEHMHDISNFKRYEKSREENQEQTKVSKRVFAN
jgi:hypothetical protein